MTKSEKAIREQRDEMKRLINIDPGNEWIQGQLDALNFALAWVKSEK